MLFQVGWVLCQRVWVLLLLAGAVLGGCSEGLLERTYGSRRVPTSLDGGAWDSGAGDSGPRSDASGSDGQIIGCANIPTAGLCEGQVAVRCLAGQRVTEVCSTGCEAPSTGVRCLPSPEANPLEDTQFQLTNQRRLAVGRAAVTWDARLARTARLHSEDMCRRQLLAHGTLEAMVARAAAQGTTISAENVGAGTSSPSQITEQWVESSGHYRNLIDSENTRLGVGYAACSGGRSQHFWTQAYGSSR